MMKIARSSILIGMVFFAVVFGSLAHGADEEDEREYRFVQGVISKYDGESFMLNEGLKVYITYETKIFDERGKQTLRRPAVSRWVYMEGPLNGDGSINAESLYLLPGRVGKKGRAKYPFMQIP